MRFVTRSLLAAALISSMSMGCAGSPEITDYTTGAEAGKNGKADDGEAAKTTCTFDNRWLADSSDKLDSASQGGTRLTAADIDRLEATTRAQLLAAAVHLQAVDAGATIEAAFDGVDDNTMFLHAVTLEGQSFEWVQFFLGDTEVGVVFNPATVTIVAEIGDGDVMGCSTAGAEPGNPDEPAPCEESAAATTCHWDTTWHTDSSDGLNDAIIDSVEVDANSDMDTLTQAQVIAAALQLQSISATDGIDAALEATDDAMWTVYSVGFDDTRYTWLEGFMGDTEVGVVFAEGTTEIVAEIGDGDVMGCL